jgi:hypothetical protein
LVERVVGLSKLVARAVSARLIRGDEPLLRVMLEDPVRPVATAVRVGVVALRVVPARREVLGWARVMVGTPPAVVRDGALRYPLEMPLTPRVELVELPERVVGALRVVGAERVLLEERPIPGELEPGVPEERPMPELRLGVPDERLLPALRLGVPDELPALRLGVPDERLLPALRLGVPDERLLPALRLGVPDERLLPALRLGVPDDRALPELPLEPPMREFPALLPPLLPPRVTRWASTWFTGAANTATAARANRKNSTRLGVSISDLLWSDAGNEKSPAGNLLPVRGPFLALNHNALSRKD